MAYNSSNPFNSPVASQNADQKELYQTWFRIADEGQLKSRESVCQFECLCIGRVHCLSSQYSIRAACTVTFQRQFSVGLTLPLLTTATEAKREPWTLAVSGPPCSKEFVCSSLK